jgi:hypothetical protein
MISSDTTTEKDGRTIRIEKMLSHKPSSFGDFYYAFREDSRFHSPV